MIREHPRFQKTAIIFVSAIHLAEIDRLRGYEMGAVDYVPVPVVPEVLRAKVRVFAELYRKTRQLERLNAELEERVARAHRRARGARPTRLRRKRAAPQPRARRPATWARGTGTCATGDMRCGTRASTASSASTRATSRSTPENVRGADPSRRTGSELQVGLQPICAATAQPHQTEFRVRRPNGEMRWCIGTAAASVDAAGKVVRISGVTIDITERKEAEERQALLAREVDHRAKNALAIVQSIVRLTRRAASRAMSRSSKGASRRCRARTRCCRNRAGRVPISPAGRGGAGAVPLDPCGTLEHRRAQVSAASRPRRRRWRWRCTSSPPMPRSTVRCPPRQAGFRSTWELQTDALTISLAGDRRAPRRRHRRSHRLRHQDHHRQHRAAARRCRCNSTGSRRDCAAPSRCRAAQGRSATTQRKASARPASASMPSDRGAARHDRRGRGPGRAWCWRISSPTWGSRSSGRSAASRPRNRPRSPTSSTRPFSTSIWAASWSIRSPTCSPPSGVPFIFVTGYGDEEHRPPLCAQSDPGKAGRARSAGRAARSQRQRRTAAQRGDGLTVSPINAGGAAPRLQARQQRRNRSRRGADARPARLRCVRCRA